MNKKLIALAVAGAFAAPAAFADVTIYGQLNGSFDSVNSGNGLTAAGAAVSGTRTSIVNSNSSRLGFKGSEDLGDGLSAVWQLESSVNFAGTNGGTNATGASVGGQNTFASRDSFVGLSSAGMGTVLAGRHDTPYKMATRGFDVFPDNIADNRSLMGGGGKGYNAITGTFTSVGAGAAFDGRQPNVLAYVTPAMSGFTGVIAYVAGAEAAANGLTGAVSTQKGSAWSLAGIYGDGPLKASVAYEVHDLGSVGTGSVGAPLAALAGLKEKAYKIGAGYTFNDFTVNGVYEHTSDNFGGTGGAGTNALGHNAYYLAGKYAFGNDAVKLAYTKVGNNNTVAAGATGAKQWAVGYDHNLSKHTTVYVLYTSLKNDANQDYTLTGGADVVANPVGSAAAPVYGASVSAFSFGLKHSF